MKLGQFLGKMIEEIKSSVKDGNYVGIPGSSHCVDLDIIVYPSGDNIEVHQTSSDPNVNRLKLILHIKQDGV